MHLLLALLEEANEIFRKDNFVSYRRFFGAIEMEIDVGCVGIE